jgi:hypothetical protein
MILLERGVQAGRKCSKVSVRFNDALNVKVEKFLIFNSARPKTKDAAFFYF